MKHKRIWVARTLLISGLLITIVVAGFVKSNVENLAKKEFADSCDEISTAIRNRLHAHAQVLRSGAAFFSVSDTVTRGQWKAFVEGSKIHLNLHGIQGTGFSLIIPGDQLHQHIQKIRNEGFPEYTVKPEGRRETYTSIVFLEPFAGRNLRAFGYDMFSEPVRREAMERARDLDVAALSGKVMLVQETEADVQAGNLMYVPVYRKGAETTTIEQRRKAIKGWVYSPYRMNDLMSGIFKGWELNENKKFSLHIFDGAECTAKSMLFESHGLDEYINPKHTRFTKQVPIDFNGHRWTLKFTLKAKNFFIDYLIYWTILLGGTLISILVFFLSRSFVRTENRAQVIAEELTSDLREASELLQYSEKQLRMTVKAGNVGLWNRDLITNKTYFSTEWKSQLGYRDEELENTYEVWQSLIHPDDLASTLAALKSSLSEPWPPYRAEFRLRHKDGSYRWIAAHGEIQFDENYKPQRILGSHIDITEHKRAEEKLKESEDKYRILAESSPEMIYLIDTNGCVAYVNKVAAEQFHTPARELVGKHLTEIFPPDLARQNLAEIQSVIATKTNFRSEVEMIFPTESKWVDARLTPVFDDKNNVTGVLGLSYDITARKVAEKEIREYAEQYDLIKTTGLLGYWLLDEKGKLIDVNEEYCRLSGYTREELLNLSISDIEIIDKPEDNARHMQNIIKNGTGQFERKHKTKDGRAFDIEVSVVHWPSQRKFILFIRDITERKQAGEEIRKLNETLEFRVKERTLEIQHVNESLAQEITERKKIEEDLKLAIFEAERANRAKSEFLSRMSHELCTPMNAILGFAQLMNMGELKPAHKKGVDHILKSGKHLLDLINEVLDISKIEAGHITLSLEPIAMCPLVREMIDVVSPIATAKQITLEAAPLNGIFVKADRQRLKQVLLNLINNAIKYNRQNGFVKINCELTEAAEKQNSTVRISITDSGAGITPEDIIKLFNPFERIGAEKTETEGTGLGLAVAKKLIEAMQGTIGVESEVGKGSTFWIELPQAEGQPDGHKQNGDFMKPETTSIGSGTLLYIEDNLSNIQLVEQILEEHRPRVRLISEMYGKNAVKLATEFKPDLILLDLDLPDIHGSEVLKLLYAEPKTTSIPVVVISADAMTKQIAKLLKSGAKDYLTKPLDVVEFLKVVDEMMKAPF